MDERIRASTDPDDPVTTDAAEFVQVPYRGCLVVWESSERTEIAFAQEMTRSLIHRFHIERARLHPTGASQERIGHL
jgi:hypothetical protein